MTPKVGDYILSDRLRECEIVRIHPFGTYDVRTLNGDRYFRLTGLHGAIWTPRGRYHPAPGSNFEPVLYSQA
jgi:hypothetical protein